jgi:hypothetical protein
VKYYLSTLEQFFTSYYSNTMNCDPILFFHILGFLHFIGNTNQPDMNDNNYERLWKISSLIYQPSDAYSKFYNPSEDLAVNEIIMLFKRRVIS